MASTVVFNGVTYNIPVTGDSNWGTEVTAYLVALATNAAVTNAQIQASRVVTSTPSNITTTDYGVFVNVASAATLQLPTSAVGQIFVIKDVSNNAAINNITVLPPVGQTIDGASGYTIGDNNGDVILQFRGSNSWAVLSSSASNLAGYQVVTLSADTTLNISNTFVRADTLTATGPMTLTLPAAPTVGQSIVVKDVGGQASDKRITLAANVSQSIDGQATYVLSQARTSLTVVYSSTNEWSVI